jgi:hypothetical protein
MKRQIWMQYCTSWCRWGLKKRRPILGHNGGTCSEGRGNPYLRNASEIIFSYLFPFYFLYLFFSFADWLRAGRPRGRSSSPGRVKNFLFSMSSRPTLRPTQPPIQWVPATLSRGIKRQGHEADHSPPASAEVKKMWIYTSTPPYAFMA